MDRYFVDKRGGCVAVRDRTKTDPGYQGLHADTIGVVRFWMGEQRRVCCPHCGNRRTEGWDVTSDIVDAAVNVCRELNEAERPKTKGA